MAKMRCAALARQLTSLLDEVRSQRLPAPAQRLPAPAQRLPAPAQRLSVPAQRPTASPLDEQKQEQERAEDAYKRGARLQPVASALQAAERFELAAEVFDLAIEVLAASEPPDSSEDDNAESEYQGAVRSRTQRLPSRIFAFDKEGTPRKRPVAAGEELDAEKDAVISEEQLQGLLDVHAQILAAKEREVAALRLEPTNEQVL